ncbi:MAG TPA: methylthioribulose 1-phosphate dehydratase [Nitrospiria bacterium]|nr:methylthioribulose 1-phosphate dehydratase [Nitrospiria bacterium]
MTNRWRTALASLGEIKKEFAGRGWMRATSGNLSLRVKKAPLEFYISVSGRDKSLSLPDDFILVNEKGTPLPDPAMAGNPLLLKPSAEVGVHAAIYLNTPAEAIFHVHTPYNTVVSKHSDSGTLILTGYEMIKGLGLWGEESKVQVPVIPNHYRLEDLAKETGGRVDSSVPGVLIEGHGLYAWGGSLQEAKMNVEAFEFLFEAWCLERQIGKAIRLPEERNG